jgi:hypothetical protein
VSITNNPHLSINARSEGFLQRGLNTLIWLTFIGLAVWGFWASVDIGIGWDEEAERATLLINLSAIAGLLQGSTQGYEALLAHGDRYYGIGFHLPAYALAHLLQNGLASFSLGAIFTNNLVLTHISVWLCFLGSALLARTLLKQLTNNVLVANLGMLTFTLWPYLLGHGLMNIKDMPFVFAWLLCTVIALPLHQIPAIGVGKLPTPSKGRILLLAMATAWLLSIRISGILIFAQYGCLLLAHWYCARTSSQSNAKPHADQVSNNLNEDLTLQDFAKEIAKQLAIFIPIFLIALIAFYPVAWHNPLELIHAISYMSHHPWDGTTLTAGRFIAPGTKLYFYLPVWLLAKLPLIALIGLLLTPLALYRQCKFICTASPAQRNAMALWMGLSGGVLAIILALMILRVGLYNELRQTLFLFPPLLLIGIASLWFIHRKATLIGLALTCVLFIWDNVTLYPYNYSYLNEVARQRPATQYFETDYFGFSAGRSGRWLTDHPQYSQAQCIYAYPAHLLSYELNSKLYPCLTSSEGNALNLLTDKPTILFITQRNLINFAIPAQCTLLHSEERALPLSRQPLIMGRVFDCKPIQ